LEANLQILEILTSESVPALAETILKKKYTRFLQNGLSKSRDRFTGQNLQDLQISFQLAGDPITVYGLDSLVAIEIRNWITRELEANLQILEILNHIETPLSLEVWSKYTRFLQNGLSKSRDRFTGQNLQDMEDLDPAAPITVYGLDSLVAIEIRNWITRELEANILGQFGLQPHRDTTQS
jgi:acyl carrier protein